MEAPRSIRRSLCGVGCDDGPDGPCRRQFREKPSWLPRCYRVSERHRDALTENPGVSGSFGSPFSLSVDMYAQSVSSSSSIHSIAGGLDQRRCWSQRCGGYIGTICGGSLIYIYTHARPRPPTGTPPHVFTTTAPLSPFFPTTSGASLIYKHAHGSFAASLTAGGR